MKTEIIVRGYMVMVAWSDDDATYIATVPRLAGCVSHGDTVEEAGRNIREAVNLWLASASRHGDAIPAPDGDEATA